MHFTPNAIDKVFIIDPFHGNSDTVLFHGKMTYFTYLILKNYLFFNVAVKYFVFMTI